jgi:TetR/AcrR family transcriptional regulator
VPDTFDAAARSSLLVAYVLGRWHRFAKSGFRKGPTEGLESQLSALVP